MLNCVVETVNLIFIFKLLNILNKISPIKKIIIKKDMKFKKKINYNNFVVSVSTSIMKLYFCP